MCALAEIIEEGEDALEDISVDEENAAYESRKGRWARSEDFEEADDFDFELEDSFVTNNHEMCND